MGAGAEFRLFGPFEVLERGQRLALGGAKQRALLAVLLLHRREAVSTDRLIDELWGDRPPATAAKTIQVYVSHLRKALGDGLLETHGHAYLLAAAPAQVDVDRFEALVADGRAALGAGEARRAAELLAGALELWRGPPLADFAYEPFAQSEMARLEEARLAALETRIEAELGLGRDAALIGELEALAREHPLRERLHELWMLALYRAGRQAEALEVYRTAHDHLDTELGLKPGPALRALEARILGHDPSLDLPRRAAAADGESSAAARSDRHLDAGRVGLAAALAAAVAIAAVVLAGGGPSNAVVAGTLRAPALGVLDGQTGEPRAAAALGAVPSRIAAGLGAEWATSYDNGTLLRIAPNHAAVTQTVYVGHGPTGVALDAGDVWVADTLDNRLTRVDAATNHVVQEIPVGASPGDVAAGGGAVWVSNGGDGTVSRIDPVTGAVLGVTRVGPSPRGVAVGAGAVWVALHGASTVARLDPRTGRLKQTIRVGSGPSAIAVGRNEVWVANELDSTVSLINPNSDSVILTRAVAGAPTALAAAGTDVWVAADAPLLTMLGASGQVRTVAIPSPATALAPSGRGLLVGVSGIGANHRGGTLEIRVSYALGHIDPASCCALNWNIRMLSYDGLVAYSKSPSSPDTLVPDLALAIPAPQAAGLSYTFRLRPGLRYWTGAPVRASDIRRGLERAAQSSDVFAAYIGALPGALACPRRRTCDLRAAVLTNNRAGTITLRLAHPDPDLLLALGLPAFAPAPAGGGIRPGTGPYRIQRYVPGQLIDFERNPYFKEWAPAAQPAGYPDRILLHTDGTVSVDVADVLSGRADYTFDYPTPSQLREIKLRFPGLLHTEPLPNTDFLPLNTHAAPFNDVRVRQALNFAVDRKAIAALYGGLNDATPTCQIIPATIPGHVPYCPYTRDPSPNGRWSAPDLPRARQLIAASGTRGELVTLVTETPSGPWDEPVGRYIVGVLRQLGYRARLQVLTPNEWSAAVENYGRPPQIVTSSWVADYPSASQWITLQLSCAEWQPPAVVSNHALFCDPTVDRLAAQAAQLQATDPIAADRLWARADRQVTNLAPWVPTVTETAADLVSARVGDYQYVPTIGPLLDQLWLR